MTSNLSLGRYQADKTRFNSQMYENPILTTHRYSWLDFFLFYL